MTSRTIDIFTKGILIEAFKSARNILIWKYIADEKEFLEKQNVYTKKLYSFLQLSAQTNFILSLSKLFDKPTNRYDTLCILFFLQQMKMDANDAAKIIETASTERILKSYDAPDFLIDAINNPNKSVFPKLFSEYYLSQYNSDQLQRDIASLKLLRDKSVAHNEAVEDLRFEFEVADRLLNYVTEIISVFDRLINLQYGGRARTHF